ncbi:MAG: dienelactone hydrolase family protein [Pseudomonadota bacterium]|nr:dienelactone hydrolase family protein [Pseudomonadota bacterium]
MLEREIDIATTDGLMNTFITHPETEGPHPTVIFLMDAPGKREELHDMARRIASVGYYVMLPNLYYRRAREWTSTGTQENREILFSHMNSLSNHMVIEDIKALLHSSNQDLYARTGAVGCVGYCMSGPFAFAAASELGHTIKAAASFHGIRLLTDEPDSPHLGAAHIKGEVYIGCAQTDDWAPTEMIEKLEQHLLDSGASYRVEWYPGTEHGFVFPLREGKYNKQAAERHWERLFDLFKRRL